MGATLIGPTALTAGRGAWVLVVVAALAACGTQPTPTPAPSAAAQSTTAPAAQTPAAVQTPTGAPSAAAVTGTDLVVWSTHDQPPRKGRVTYRVHYANLGLTVAARDAVLQVTPPDGARITRVNRESQPLAAGGGVEVALGTVQPSTSDDVDVDVDWATAPAQGSWTELKAQISAAETDPDSTNNAALDGERVPAPDLSLSMAAADDSGPFVPGGNVSYRLTYDNIAPGDATAPTLTVRLPAGVTFSSARGDVAGTPTTTADGIASIVSLPLRAVGPLRSGSVVLLAALAPDLEPGQSVTASALIATDADATAADNRAESVQVVQPVGPDAWVALDGKGATELNGTHRYRLRYGNRGTAAADGASLSLVVPDALGDLHFSVPPTTLAGGTATWVLGTLQPSMSRTIEFTATITGTGSKVTPTTEITTATDDANRGNNAAEVTDDLVAIAMPTISGPVNAIVGARPVFFGTGTPAATVSLSLAGPDGGAGQLLGTDTVDGNGAWEIQPAADLPDGGWHWFTATQQLGDLVSERAGVADYTSSDTAIDTSTLTVNGKRVGGIDQVISWPAAKQLLFGATIASCATPISPMLQADYYDSSGAVVNRQLVEPSRADPGGVVAFAFVVPRITQEVQWQLSLAFYCGDAGQSDVRTGVRQAVYVAGILDAVKRKIDCWFGNCTKSPPPPPPKPCPGCTPWKPPKKPSPDPLAPGGIDWVLVGQPTATREDRRLA